MTIDRATPATQNGHDKSIRYRPSHDTNLQQAQAVFLVKYDEFWSISECALTWCNNVFLLCSPSPVHIIGVVQSVKTCKNKVKPHLSKFIYIYIYYIYISILHQNSRKPWFAGALLRFHWFTARGSSSWGGRMHTCRYAIAMPLFLLL